MGRQHQGMDRPGVLKVPEGSGEQEKMEKTGYKIICGAPMTLTVKGLMMMMMMMIDLHMLVIPWQLKIVQVNTKLLSWLNSSLQSGENNP